MNEDLSALLSLEEDLSALFSLKEDLYAIFRLEDRGPLSALFLREKLLPRMVTMATVDHTTL